MIIQAMLIGLIATVIADIFALMVKKIWQVPALDFAWVGRLALYMGKGKFFHQTILQSAPLSGEKTIGWFLHYAIGVVLAAIMLIIAHYAGIEAPSIVFALSFGIVTVLLPYLWMQPAFGFGIAASKTPNPKISRLRSLLAHIYFGIGLALAWVLLS